MADEATLTLSKAQLKLIILKLKTAKELGRGSEHSKIDTQAETYFS